MSDIRKVTKIGGSLFVGIPADIAKKLDIREGDDLK